MPPEEVQVFEPRLIARGPDEIRGQVGSLAFIYTKYDDPDGNRWFVRPGYVGQRRQAGPVQDRRTAGVDQPGLLDAGAAQHLGGHPPAERAGAVARSDDRDGAALEHPAQPWADRR